MKSGILASLVVSVMLISGCTNAPAYGNYSENSQNSSSSSFLTYAQGNISIKYPAGWNITSTIYNVVFSCPVEAGFSPTLTISAAETNETIEKAAENANKKQSVLAQHAIINEAYTTISGEPAFRRTYSWLDRAHNLAVTQAQVWVRSSGKLYTITATSLSSTFKEYEAAFDEMISSANFY